MVATYNSSSNFRSSMFQECNLSSAEPNNLRRAAGMLLCICTAAFVGTWYNSVSRGSCPPVVPHQQLHHLPSLSAHASNPTQSSSGRQGQDLISMQHPWHIPCISTANGSSLPTSQQFNMRQLAQRQRLLVNIDDHYMLSGEGRSTLLSVAFAIPKVIHQVWMGSGDPPAAHRSWSDGYMKRCTGWQYQLWTPVQLGTLQYLQLGSEHTGDVPVKPTKRLAQLPLTAGRGKLAAAILLEFGGVLVPASATWGGHQCLDNLTLAGNPTGAVVAVHAGTGSADSLGEAAAVVASVKHHPFIRQWFNLEVALAGMPAPVSAGKLQPSVAAATAAVPHALAAALRVADNHLPSKHCLAHDVAASNAPGRRDLLNDPSSAIGMLELTPSYFTVEEPASSAVLVSLLGTTYSDFLLLNDSATLQAGKAVATSTPAQPGTAAKHSATQPRRCSSTPSLVTLSASPGPLHRLPCCDLATRQLDIVVSHCREDLTQLQHILGAVANLPNIAALQPCVFLYTKCGQLEAVRGQLPSTVHVEALNNIGREGHTYLTHIIRHYGSLPAYSMFLQAGVEVADQLVPRLEGLHNNTGFINLGNPWILQAVHADKTGHVEDQFVRLAELYSWVYQDLAPPRVDLTYQGQFLVAKQRIEAHPRRFYQQLLHYLRVPLGHFLSFDWKYINVPKKWAKPTSQTQLNNPQFGHVLERAWGFIFLCGPQKDSPVIKDGLTCV